MVSVSVPAGGTRRRHKLTRQLGVARLITTALLIVLALLVARFSWKTPFVLDAEGVLFDFRSALASPTVDQDSRIVLVVYDEDTLRLTGKRSPLDRTVLAKALKRIDTMGAKSIGIDILIDQPQPEDPVLIDAFRHMKTPTSLAYATTATAEEKTTYSQQKFVEQLLRDVAPGNVHATSIRLEADAGNVLRRWPPRVKGLPPTMPNAVDPASTAFSNFTGSVEFRQPSDPERGVFSVVPIQSFTDDAMFAIPEAAAMFAEQIKGRHVLIGGHIQDIDLFLTPLTRATRKQTWGLDIFGHMLAQQLDKRMPATIPSWVLWVAAIAAVGSGVVTALGTMRAGPLAVLMVIQIALIGYLPFYLQQHLVDTYGLPVFGWVVGWILAFTAVGTAARAIGSEQRKFAQSALGKYLPRDIAAEILRDPDGLKLHGEKREIFVVFTDLEGFTKLSHAIEPEIVATILNSYLEILSDIVLDHGGTIDKFVGDAVVAFWGAPIARPDDGERAGRAAWAMCEAGETFRKGVPDGVPAIGRTRVGLHHGEAIVGNFGGEGRIQYTALGDSMNTAARLESANKQLNSRMLVSREAAELSGLDWYRPLGRVVLRGRSTPIDVFEPAPQMSAQERADFAAIVTRATKGNLQAIEELKHYSDLHPDDAAVRNLVYRTNNQSDGGYYVLD
ncbi:adenylate/guanylate cyclase domain-containing protein [soil metagenome]